MADELAFAVVSAGRVIAEADDLASARYAAGVLLDEDELERVDVVYVARDELVGYLEHATIGDGHVWRSSTVARRFE